MKKEVLAFHCDDKPQTIFLEEGDKAAFVCESCRELFEIDSDGKIRHSPLKVCDIVRKGNFIHNRRRRIYNGGNDEEKIGNIP